MTLFSETTEHSVERVALAKKFLENDDTHASTLLASARIVLGPAVASYEFDTIRKGLEGHDVVMPQPNIDRLFAAITLLVNPVFCWEAYVFSATIRAFAGEDVAPEVLEPMPPVYLGWGIQEAALITNVEFNLGIKWIADKIDGEVLEYIVGSLHDAGFVVCPHGVEWAQQYLDQVLESPTLTQKVQAEWDKLEKKSLADREYAEDEVGVQLARLAGCYLYYRSREVTQGTQLAALKAV